MKSRYVGLGSIPLRGPGPKAITIEPAPGPAHGKLNLQRLSRFAFALSFFRAGGGRGVATKKLGRNEPGHAVLTPCL